MDTKTSNTTKHSQPVMDKLTSTLMGYVQKYAVYDLPETDNQNNISISQLKTTCEGVGAAILRATSAEVNHFKNI